MNIGTDYFGKGNCQFTVWAPSCRNVTLKILEPEARRAPMNRDPKGYWRILLDNVFPGATYRYVLDDEGERPDPASNEQPYGVHRESRVVDHAEFHWTDGHWKGISSLDHMIAYELHVGTFTPEGTFDAVIDHLEELRELGVNSVELMPVAQFPGIRNWGYDGVYPFAVQDSYGGPSGLKRLVNACHALDLAVILDVVYNHLGPEGNYLREFGPYFTETYRTPWGEALNFDGPLSDHVRNFFIENALHWFRRYHVDALRLDAVHGIFDSSAKPFLEELAEKVSEVSRAENKSWLLIAESDLNDPRILRPREVGGFGLDAQWSDDFHHAVHTLLTGETSGYYLDFGKMEHLGKAYSEGFVYSWDYSAYRRRRHGRSSLDRPGRQFVVCIQNHDQVGNRMLGERLSLLVPFEALKLAAGALLLSPFVPLLFMGEEYGEEAPFLYFVDHSDADLVAAVRKGRRQEFQAFNWHDTPPDPQDPDTMRKSRLNLRLRDQGKHGMLFRFYKELIRIRKTLPALQHPDKHAIEVTTYEVERILTLRRWYRAGAQSFILFNFNDTPVPFLVSLPDGEWRKILDSSAETWGGPGTRLPERLWDGNEVTPGAWSLALYASEV